MPVFGGTYWRLVLPGLPKMVDVSYLSNSGVIRHACSNLFMIKHFPRQGLKRLDGRFLDPSHLASFLAQASASSQSTFIPVTRCVMQDHFQALPALLRMYASSLLSVTLQSFEARAIDMNRQNGDPVFWPLPCASPSFIVAI